MSRPRDAALLAVASDVGSRGSVRAWSAAMKYIAAAALLIAGAYLPYPFYVAYSTPAIC